METIERITQEIMADPANRSYTERGIPPLFSAPTTARINIVGQAPGVRAQTSERTAGLAASYENEGDLIRVELRSLCSPHHLTLTLAFGKADLTLTLAGLTADRYPQDSLHAVEV